MDAMADSRRIAIVSQHLDQLGLDDANSVGSCSRELASELAKQFEVAVYGRAHSKNRQDLPGVKFRFIHENRGDRIAGRFLRRTRRLHPLFNRGFPITTSTSRLASPFWGRAVARDLAKWSPDLILVQHNARRVPLIKRLLPDVTTILLLHQVPFEQERTASYRKAILRADVVAAVSPFTAEATEEYIGRPVSLIRNGVRDKFIETNRIRSDKGPRLLFAAAVSPEKGLHILCGAFARILEELPDATLTIIGGTGARNVANVFPHSNEAYMVEARAMFHGDYRRHIVEQLPTRVVDRIAFRGFVASAELYAAFASADILSMPSLWDESFGLPVVEAMAAGVPVVATESGALPWLVDNNRAGIIVPKGDEAALAKAIINLWKDKNQFARIAKAGKERAINNFLWSKSVEDLLALAPMITKHK